MGAYNEFPIAALLLVLAAGMLATSTLCCSSASVVCRGLVLYTSTGAGSGLS